MEPKTWFWPKRNIASWKIKKSQHLVVFCVGSMKKLTFDLVKKAKIEYDFKKRDQNT